MWDGGVVRVMTHESDDLIDPTLLERYLSGNCSAEEARAVARWMSADPLRGTVVQRLQTDVEAGTAAEIEAVWHDVQARVAQASARESLLVPTNEISRAPSRGISRVPGGSRPRPIGWIAIGLGLAFLGIFVQRGVQRSRAVPSEATGAVYRTGLGQRATITLSDGSRVVLAPQSELRVSSDYGTGSRMLTLTGEGYFDVAPRRALPFVVRSGPVDTRVLGTAFDVRRYPSDTATYVAVTTGKVAVRARGNTQRAYALTAGMAGTITDSMDVTVSTVTGADYGAWRSGALQFKNAKLSDILATLTRWYGYEFQLADSSLAHRHVTAVLDASSSQEALATLKLLLDVDLTFSGSEITLTPRDPSRSAAPRHRPVRDRALPSTTEVGR